LCTRSNRTKWRRRAKLRNFKARRVLFLALLASFAAANAGAFGKSVVRNEKFSWRVLATEHFDIYYYEEEDFLLDWAAELAEDAYDKVSDNLGFDLSKRVPVVVFMSARHFEQNNISTVSGEAVGGFAEPLKGRLVMPYNGSQRQFDETMTHEMTHIFQFELLFPTFGALFTVARRRIGLWRGWRSTSATT